VCFGLEASQHSDCTEMTKNMKIRLGCCTVTLLTFVLIMAFSRSPAEGFLVDVHIYGQVLGHVSEDGERRPINGAQVSIDFDGTILGTVTDTSGYYAIEDLMDISAGEYTVVAQADLCDPDAYVVVVSVGWNGDEEVNFDLSCSDVSAVPGYIKGCVYDFLTQSAIGDATVTYWNDTDGSFMVSIPSDGCYFRTVGAGWWNISASASGYDSVTYSNVFVGPWATVTRSFSLDRIVDLNGDKKIDLSDAILILQILGARGTSATTYQEADINGDGRIGWEEIFYVLRRVSEL
jgi:hypothetical protein